MTGETPPRPSKAELEAQVAAEAKKRTAKKAAAKKAAARRPRAKASDLVEVTMRVSTKGTRVGESRRVPKATADRLVRQRHADLA